MNEHRDGAPEAATAHASSAAPRSDRLKKRYSPPRVEVLASAKRGTGIGQNTGAHESLCDSMQPS